MSKKPNLVTLEPLFAKDVSFSLTEAQYEAKTGARLPKDSRYLMERSALAKLCKSKGYNLLLQEKMVFIQKENFNNV